MHNRMQSLRGTVRTSCRYFLIDIDSLSQAVSLVLDDPRISTPVKIHMLS